MNDPQSNRFRFNPDDDPVPSTLLEEPAADAQLDKLRRRLNRTTAIMPLLLVVALGGIYWALSKQVNRSRDSGSIEVLKLSKDLEASFSALSVKQAKLDEILNKQVEPMNARLASYDQTIKELEGGLQNLEKRMAAMGKSKLGPEDLEKTSAALTDKISGIALELNRFTEKMEGAESAVAAQVKQVSATLDQTVLELADMTVAMDAAQSRLNELQNRIETVRSSRVTNERLNAALNDMRLNLQDNDTLTLLVSEQSVIEKRINGLETQLNSLREQMGRLGARPSSLPAPNRPPAAGAAPAAGFQEQDIN